MLLLLPLLFMMPDYNTLTVVKLRELLVNRGLPKTGLKHVLVSRLHESDAQIQHVTSTTDVQPVDQPTVVAEQVSLNAPPPLAQAQDPGGTEGGPNALDKKGLHPSAPETRSIIGTDLEEKISLPVPKPLDAVQKQDVIQPPPEETSQDEPSIHVPNPEQLETQENNLSLNGTLNNELSSADSNLVEEIVEKKSVNEPTIEPSLNRALTEELSSGGADPASKIVEKQSANEPTTEVSLDGILNKDLSSGGANSVDKIVEKQSANEPTIEPLLDGTLDKRLSSTGVDSVDKIVEVQSVNEPSTEPSLNGALSEEVLSGGAVSVENLRENNFANESVIEASYPTNKSPLPDSTQVPLSTKEFLEDSRKRKRRSQSPPPSAIESVQKRAKTEGSRPDVKLPEDMDAEELRGVEAEVALDTSMTDIAPAQFQEATQTATDTPTPMEGLPTAPDFGASIDQGDVPGPIIPDYHMSEDLKDRQHDKQDPTAHTQIENLPPDTERTAALSLAAQRPPATEKTSSSPSSQEPKNENETIPALPSGEQLINQNEKIPALHLSEELQADTEKTPIPRSSDGPQPDFEKTLAQHSNEESPGKHSPSDTRFKNLFAGPSKREVSPLRQPSYADQENRVISSALHPATSALYIRDFMRPLHPDNLKAYLISLASPSGATPNAQIITEFFLDPIRTHCLVGFDNTSAASRVRSSLHNRVWPNERSRRPLWVDFVPEEKLKKWIEVELETSSSRGQSGKRWEVVYEEEEDGMHAYLQEADANSMAPRPPQPHVRHEEAGQGVQGAPSGPRSREVEPRPPQSGGTLKPDMGKGFQALDDLFQSTDAKPKLYYLPVDKSTVNRRLDALDAGRGGGRGDEMRRYSFEEDTIVDRGPEFGARGRGGHGGRGGSYGRGGGYRGDNWRDRR